MAQRRGTFLLRRAGWEQKSGLTLGHPGDPVPEKICSDTGFCCAQFRVSPACILLPLMGKESTIVRRMRAPLSLCCSRGYVGTIVPLELPQYGRTRMGVQGHAGVPCTHGIGTAGRSGILGLGRGLGGHFSLSQPQHYQ